MFIISVKASKKKIITFCLLALAFVSLVIIAVNTGDKQIATAKKISPVSVKTNEERISYLKTFGWEVSSEPIEIQEVAIPTEFDDVYTKYNKIQTAQGFDLETFKGKRVKRWTYEVTNYPNKSDNIRANILVYNNEVVGGDICTVSLDGFMHGFALPK